MFSIRWSGLVSYLGMLWVPPVFISWVKLLYTEPLVRLRVNGIISEPFPIFCETRQGWPLSPFLFALAIEHLVVSLHSSPTFSGLLVGQLEQRFSLYAGDMLLYLQDPSPSLLVAFECDGFCRLP